MCNSLRCPRSGTDVSSTVSKWLELKLYETGSLIGGGVVKAKPSKGSRCDDDKNKMIETQTEEENGSRTMTWTWLSGGQQTGLHDPLRCAGWGAETQRKKAGQILLEHWPLDGSIFGLDALAQEEAGGEELEIDVK
jgi:hypothetical protein